MKIASEIRALLKATTSEMARKMGMRDATMWKCFERAKNPSMKNVLKLAEIARAELGWDLNKILAAWYKG